MAHSIKQVYELGQSIWYDNIERRLLENGELKQMIESGKIYGVTSNPSIFQKAIAETMDYDDSILPMALSGLSAEEVFYELAIEDIQNAADLFLPLYNASQGKDGYVSLEVNPLYANDAEATLVEAQNLWRKVNRPNLMVKIPATIAGLPAIRQAIALGININVTLIFSVERYEAVIDAYLNGLEDRHKKDLPITQIASVASFFVSRVDSKVDKMLDALVLNGNLSASAANQLRGKTGLANSRLAYQVFRKKFFTERFQQLKDAGGIYQRPLWASTSTKNPDFSDILYIEGLIAPDTVNTVPPQTLQAFLEHGAAEIGFDPRSEEPRQHIRTLKDVGIDILEVTAALEEEGVDAFAQAYQSLLDTLQERISITSKQLGELQTSVQDKITRHAQNRTIERLFAKDPTLWTTEESAGREITNRLGWLDLPVQSQEQIPRLDTFFKEVKGSGLKTAVLLGMGGSSLASEVIAKTLKSLEPGNKEGLDLIVLDSTNPVQINTVLQSLDLPATLFIVSSKSGTTTETLSLMEFFWQKIQENQGKKAGDHFIAITDPGSKLADTAQERRFRAVFFADPEVGGRYSALTNFGLVPAKLVGVDIPAFLHRAEKAMQACRPETPAYRNPGLVLGTIISEAMRLQKDKLTFIAGPQASAFGSWAEQLIAESSGKDGKGIIPVDGEPHYPTNAYAKDRLFINIAVDQSSQQTADRISESGQPVVPLQLKEFLQLAEMFYIWEIAVAVACADLGVNAFNQPNVQDSKDRTRQKIEQMKKDGKLDKGKPVFQDNLVKLYWPGSSQHNEPQSIDQIFKAFMSDIQPGDYFSINAFLPQSAEVEAVLQALRGRVTQKTHTATTLGFGPRFLHSTGQLHKGGPNKGYFLVITHDSDVNLEVPGQNISFGGLIEAQAQGDIEAILAKDRRVLHLHLSGLENLEAINTLYPST